MRSSDFANMLGDSGAPRLITLAIMRRKLGKIANGKAPGFSGDGPDLYATLPDCWVEWAVELANIIQFTQITPRAWHIDLVHYVHKGGSDGSLPTYRPLALVEVFRKVSKVFTSIICDRMKRDFAHLLILDPTNPGFQSGRTTANSIFPLRAVAEHCQATGTEFSCLLGAIISKILNNHLSTEPRVSMWDGVQAGTLTCGCGQVLQWSDRDYVGPLHWHFLQ